MMNDPLWQAVTPLAVELRSVGGILASVGGKTGKLEASATNVSAG